MLYIGIAMKNINEITYFKEKKMVQVSILSSEDTKKLLKMEDVIVAVEDVYAKKAEGKTNVYPMVFHEFNPGVADMDIKSGEIKGDVFGLKLVSWFSENPSKGLPALFGTILVCDTSTGAPMGIVDGAYITGMRTGAAAAVGAKYLARKDSETLLMVGAGHICLFAVAASLKLLPNIKKVLICSPLFPEEEKNAVASLKEKLVNDFKIELSNIEIDCAVNLEASCKKTDIIITATPSKVPFIKKEWIKQGTHFSCIGSDMEGKQEIESEISINAVIFTDDNSQCINVGEIEIPIKKGIISKENIKGEIGQLIIGQVSGRSNNEEITIYDTTGVALLDLATAKIALKAASKEKLGVQVNL